jgi:hypothetical protein
MSTILGWASVDADGNVLAWGGAATTSVSVSKGGTGVYAVMFRGNYPGVTSFDDVTYMVSSSNTQTFDVAAIDFDASGASTTGIDAEVKTWSTETEPRATSDAAFSVMILMQ